MTFHSIGIELVIKILPTWKSLGPNGKFCQIYLVNSTNIKKLVIASIGEDTDYSSTASMNISSHSHCRQQSVCVCVSRYVMPNSYGPMDCSPPGSSFHGILQARLLEWVAIPFSRGSSRPKDRTWVSCIADRFFTI